MPKMKSRSAAKKRFKLTGGKKGKIKRASGLRRHLLSGKTPKSKRQLRKGTYISDADIKRIRQLISV